ncbi:glycosyltransferase family 2 protein [Vreelandella utahensis]|uniref:glycosyltransferase family 2 protein n=1 Tax=Vreelandella halophila TaxID=86177 RepID=UPI001C4DF132|nr:glycosyltransferase family 2 protein [Halomonas utahensis]
MSSSLSQFSTAVTVALVAAFASALITDFLLPVLVGALSLLGLALIARPRVHGTRILPVADREIKLIGFALNFFAIVSLVSWLWRGASPEYLQTLGSHLLLLLFWPLFVVLSHARVRTIPALLGVALGAAGLLMTGNAASPLQEDPLQIAMSLGGAGLIAWMLLIGIPLVQFGQLLRHHNPRVAGLATAGALIPVAYLLLGFGTPLLDDPLYAGFYVAALTTLTHLTWRAVDTSLYRQRGQRISTTIITYNEADNIAACLESVQPVSDEIIVIDSGSTDDTVRIARQYTDRVTVTDWPGFGPQKQRALEQATGDWVLSIDADERITPYLAREINHRLSDNPGAEAFKLRWAVTIYGKRLDFGRSARAPLRLFRREGAAFSDAQVHEAILLPDGARIRTLRGRLTHYTHRDYGHALAKSAQYSWLSAQQKAEKGKRTRTLIYPTLRAITTFIQVYILRLGFLDGPVGYLMAVTYAQTSFNTYTGLWTLGRGTSTDNYSGMQDGTNE